MVACGGCERLGVVESGQCERQDIGTFRVLECSPSQLELTNVPAASWCMSLCQCMSLRQAVCPCGNVCPCGKCMFCSTYVPAARMSLQQCMSLRQADALQRKCLLARPNFEKEGKGRVRLRV
jgi:hypothetical protein